MKVWNKSPATPPDEFGNAIAFQGKLEKIWSNDPPLSRDKLEELAVSSGKIPLPEQSIRGDGNIVILSLGEGESQQRSLETTWDLDTLKKQECRGQCPEQANSYCASPNVQGGRW